jgi:hypothetical protein
MVTKFSPPSGVVQNPTIFVALSPTSYVAYYNACIVYIPTLLRNIIFCKGVERMGTPIAFLNALFAGETNYLLGESFI